MCNLLPEFSSIAPPDGGTGVVGSCLAVFSPYAPGKINCLILYIYRAASKLKIAHY